MKYLTMFFVLVLTLTLTACPFKKKKETPPWVVYQKNTEVAIQSLKTLQEIEFEKTDPNVYKESLKKTETTVNEFLNSNKSEPAKPSYLEIEAALQDFYLAAELIEKKRSRGGDSFFANKLFASEDAELFTKVKQRYKLGPELQTASHNYYYIDPILHEALRSANNRIERANKKLKEEVILEAKAARAAKSGNQNSNLQTNENALEPVPIISPNPNPSPSPSTSPSSSKQKNSTESKTNKNNP
jgi:hypothetical protein